MKRNNLSLLQNGIAYGLTSALLYAGVISLIDLAGKFSGNIYCGAAVGFVSGFFISTVIGVVDDLLSRGKINNNLFGWTYANVIIGAFTGAIVSTLAVIFLVPLIAGTGESSAWCVMMGRLIGTPLGILIGIIIGVSWQRVAPRTA